MLITFVKMHHPSWNPLFEQYEFDLEQLYTDNCERYPPKECVFNAFKIDVKEIKICLIAQDPFHNPGEAMGLCFSVSKECKIPPSLQNIFKELQIEYDNKFTFTHGDLTNWMTREKMFLLNASLTVKRNQPASDMGVWMEFTNDAINFLSENNENCVFVLLGNFAKNKKKFIKKTSRVIEGVHPSPLSARNGFFNSGIFKKIEEKVGKINWQN